MALYEVPAVEALPFYHDGAIDHENPHQIQSRFTISNEEDPDSETSSPCDTESEKDSLDLNGENSVEGADAKANVVDEGNHVYSTFTVPIESLPPLPEPEHEILRHETIMGMFVVISSSLLLPICTHFLALEWILPESSDANITTAKTVFLSLVYSEAVAALVCLFGILKVDPCVIHRSPETSFPIPPPLDSWVMEVGGTKAEELPKENRDRSPPKCNRYIQGSDPASGVYCTKCFVWRKPGKKHFHCIYCQRCSAYHDHHCNFFGRCIAGKPKFWERSDDDKTYAIGNLIFFYAIIAVGAAAYTTVLGAFLFAFSIRYGAKYAIPIGLTILLLVPFCCGCSKGPLRLILWPIHCVIRLTKRLLRYCIAECNPSSDSDSP